MFNKLSSWLSSQSGSDNQQQLQVYAPLSGQVIALSDVPDPVFAQRMLGDGLAIEPASTQALAPFDGTVAAVFPTMHAIGLRSSAGLECLIHIGIDTVTLQGEGFRLLVTEGQQVKRGTALIELDYTVLNASGKALVTPVIITSSDRWQIVERTETGTVEAGIDILYVVKQV